MEYNQEQFIQANRNLWDEWADLHQKSDYYDLRGFKVGKTTLKSIERTELGEVTGKSLLHLQCHFGLDTLSWARAGATVTGLDFSSRAIELARSLSQELSIPANFICSDVYEAPRILGNEQFEIVFTSYGVLCWLPDLSDWAGVIFHLLKPGGIFYMVEHHPFATVFGEKPDNEDFEIQNPYFHSPDPQPLYNPESYAGTEERGTMPVEYEWRHSLGEVITTLCQAGLRLEFLHEFPYSDFHQLKAMKEDENGWWRLPDHPGSLPCMFSLKATKPGE